MSFFIITFTSHVPRRVTQVYMATLEEVKMRERELAFFFTEIIFSFISVVSLTLCNTAWNYLEVKEDSNNNIFTCTELAATETVYWTWKTNNQDQPISHCPPLPSTCSESFFKRFRTSRISDTVSIITIDARNVSDSSAFGTTSLICEASTKISCLVDSVCKYLLSVRMICQNCL